MNKHPFRLGPLGLLLLLIAVAMTVLAMLTFSTSRADEALAVRFANTVNIRYRLEEEGQRYLMQLAETGVGEGELVEHEIEKEGYLLTIKVSSENDKLKITEWKIIKQWNYDDNIDDLWQGD